MARKNSKLGAVDGGAGKGILMAGRDKRPPTGYLEEEGPPRDDADSDMLWDEGDPADRRRDPLRR